MKSMNKNSGKKSPERKAKKRTALSSSMIAESALSRQTGLDLYNQLIKKFPLRPLRSETQYEKAVKISEDMLDRTNSLTRAEKDYFDVLDYLIGEYEDREFAEDRLECQPRELIQSLMHCNGLRQSDLIPFFGSKSRVSEFLSGRRDLTLPQIQALCERFKLRAEALLPRLKEAAGS